MKIKNVLKFVSTCVFVGLALWMFLSVREVACNNMNTDYVYSAWNLFELLF